MASDPPPEGLLSVVTKKNDDGTGTTVYIKMEDNTINNQCFKKEEVEFFDHNNEIPHEMDEPVLPDAEMEFEVPTNSLLTRNNDVSSNNPTKFTITKWKKQYKTTSKPPKSPLTPALPSAKKRSQKKGQKPAQETDLSDTGLTMFQRSKNKRQIKQATLYQAPKSDEPQHSTASDKKVRKPYKRKHKKRTAADQSHLSEADQVVLWKIELDRLQPKTPRFYLRKSAVQHGCKWIQRIDPRIKIRRIKLLQRKIADYEARNQVVPFTIIPCDTSSIPTMSENELRSGQLRDLSQVKLEVAELDCANLEFMDSTYSTPSTVSASSVTNIGGPQVKQEMKLDIAIASWNHERPCSSTELKLDPEFQQDVGAPSQCPEVGEHKFEPQTTLIEANIAENQQQTKGRKRKRKKMNKKIFYTSFQLFTSELKPKLKGMSPQEFWAECGKRWAQLDLESKEQYKLLADEQNLRTYNNS